VVHPLPPALACLLLATACTGPCTVVHNPEEHRVFVDGLAAKADLLPYRYYGTGRWDAVPGDRDGHPDWSRSMASGPIEMPPPASPWLFPLDFPLELLRRAWFGREDVHVTIEVPSAGDDAVVEPGVPPHGVDAMVARAQAPRNAR
jgi:hypothetical protein